MYTKFNWIEFLSNEKEYSIEEIEALKKRVENWVIFSKDNDFESVPFYKDGYGDLVPIDNYLSQLQSQLYSLLRSFVTILAHGKQISQTDKKEGLEIITIKIPVRIKKVVNAERIRLNKIVKIENILNQLKKVDFPFKVEKNDSFELSTPFSPDHYLKAVYRNSILSTRNTEFNIQDLNKNDIDELYFILKSLKPFI